MIIDDDALAAAARLARCEANYSRAIPQRRDRTEPLRRLQARPLSRRKRRCSPNMSEARRYNMSLCQSNASLHIDARKHEARSSSCGAWREGFPHGGHAQDGGRRLQLPLVNQSSGPSNGGLGERRRVHVCITRRFLAAEQATDA